MEDWYQTICVTICLVVLFSLVFLWRCSYPKECWQAQDVVMCEQLVKLRSEQK